ncbi:putative reverse transcriptase/RNA-dependent DNA polymerase [Citrus sinensis]|nr:putative reverse transcriptase/RNA-dependent DNA polymerase [Citrus sinensis]
MDMEELIWKCKAITLDEEEADQIIFGGQMKEKGSKAIAGCLVGKILLARGVNREGLKVALHQAWRTIQIHNVSLMCMDASIIRELGSRVGKVEDIGTDAQRECFGEYMHIRVSVNITKPLKKIIVLKQEGEEDIPMLAVYERLPDLCYSCGCIVINSENEYRDQKKEELPFGPWLKAISLTDRTKLNKSRGKGKEEEVNNELNSKQSRPKWKRWKNQAQETNKKQSSKVGHSSSKRSSSEAKWESLNKKKAKKTSLSKEDQTARPIKSPSAKFKLSWEVTAMEVMDVSKSARKDLSNDDLELEIVSYSNHHIDGLVKGVDGKLWRCTGIYGHPAVNQKRHIWTLMRSLSGLFSYLWICCGDFNEILNLVEKTGGNDRNLSMVAYFKAAVEDCHLTDVECRGYPFTWSNRRFGPYFVEEKGKKILIKAVAQSVPTYDMSVFKILLGVCDDMQRTIVKFWWGSTKEKRNIHWSRWELMSQAKIRGGLGFKDLSCFNQVLVAKQGWRIMQAPDSLVARILKASNWIPRPTTFKPIIPPSLPSETLVADLIDENNYWKESSIYGSFEKEDADAILQIPLPRKQNEDKLIWHYDRRGQYLVKSGYQLVVPKKVKIFLWRAAKDLLPTAENLWKKRVMHEATCLVCGSQMETLAHALLAYKIAKKVWKNSPLENHVQGKNFPDVISIIQSLPQQQKELNGEVVASLLWTIWNARNKWLFKGVNEDPVRLVARASSVADSIKRIKVPEEEFCAEMVTTKHQQWCPPEEGWIKINVNTAMDEENRLAGLGVVIRNFKGEIIAAAVKTKKNSENVEMAEAKAVLWGLQVAIMAEATQVIVESDSKGVIELITNKMGTLTEIFWVIFDILETKKSFQNFKTQHVPRSCNVSTHSLAKLASRKLDSFVWLDEFPAEVLHLFSL